MSGVDDWERTLAEFHEEICKAVSKARAAGVPRPVIIGSLWSMLFFEGTCQMRDFENEQFAKKVRKMFPGEE